MQKMEEDKIKRPTPINPNFSAVNQTSVGYKYANTDTVQQQPDEIAKEEDSEDENSDDSEPEQVQLASVLSDKDTNSFAETYQILNYDVCLNYNKTYELKQVSTSLHHFITLY